MSDQGEEFVCCFAALCNSEHEALKKECQALGVSQVFDDQVEVDMLLKEILK
jgi:hypothetical protein